MDIVTENVLRIWKMRGSDDAIVANILEQKIRGRETCTAEDLKGFLREIKDDLKAGISPV